MTNREYDLSVIESMRVVNGYIKSQSKIDEFLLRVELASQHDILTEEDLDYIAALSVVANDVSSKWAKFLSDMTQSN